LVDQLAVVKVDHLAGLKVVHLDAKLADDLGEKSVVQKVAMLVKKLADLSAVVMELRMVVCLVSSLAAKKVDNLGEMKAEWLDEN
jgi:hypothetical protein